MEMKSKEEEFKEKYQLMLTIPEEKKPHSIIQCLTLMLCKKNDSQQLLPPTTDKSNDEDNNEKALCGEGNQCDYCTIL